MKPPACHGFGHRRRGRSSGPLCVLTFLLFGVGGCRHESTNEARWQALDPDGGEVEILPDGATTSVLVFIAPDCPISNRYVPTLARLHADFASHGVRFFAVYSGSHFTTSTIARHAEEYAIPFAVALDPESRLVRATGVSVTPEVAVIDLTGRLLYRGRIDDRYVDFGRYRQSPTREDLRIALTEILAGEPVSVTTTRAIGCYLSSEPVGDGTEA